MFEVSQACSVRNIVMAAKEMLDWPGFFFLNVFQNPPASIYEEHTRDPYHSKGWIFLFKVWIFIQILDFLLKVWILKLVNT